MKSLRRLIAFSATILSCAVAAESPRQLVPLASWQFTEDAPPVAAGAHAPPAGAAWKPVTVPHVFRQSGLPDNTAGWYRQVFKVTEAERANRVYLKLEGAASIKDVYVNGRHVGTHKGAFSGSTFDLTPALEYGRDNMLDVRVGNRDDEVRNTFSRSTLYYVNGGMFRKAWLVKTGAVHVFPDMGSSGLYLTPRNVRKESVDLEIRTHVRNPLDAPAEVTLRYSILDPAGAAAGSFEKKQTLAAGETAVVEATRKITKPALWDLGKPNLYTVKVELLADGKASDSITERTGFRTIEWKDKRFYLNGREVQFRGVNKHAQTEYEWNAIHDDELAREWGWMMDMGVNAVRLAHYPHSRFEYDIADEKGVAVWAENGYAGHIWKGADEAEKTVSVDGERLTREMIRQNWNHPGILFWSAGNETIHPVASHYAHVIREEKDPSRLVTYAADRDEPGNCDFVAWNTYDGWYKNHYTQFSEQPRNALISETGSGYWLTHHVPYGALKWVVDKFEPEEYADIFTEYRLQTICRDDVANRPMFFWWNFREFYNLKFKQNRNTKGLITLAGKPKDGYFLFQSFLNPAKPVLHLCGNHHFLRRFAPDNGIKVYSNAKMVRLVLNGAPAGERRNGDYRLPDSEIKPKDGPVIPVPGSPVDNVFFWKIALKPGRNVIEAIDERGNRDRMVIHQKNDGVKWPADDKALVRELKSSNPASPAYFIDRPVEAQGPFYSEVDGSSDNTFDRLPEEIEGSAWISTRRLGDPKNKTDLSFRIRPDAGETVVSVMFSTGEYPVVTLKKPDAAIAAEAAALRTSLAAAGFQDTGKDAVWRDHDLNRANARVWTRTVKGGDTLTLPGHTLDYVVLVRSAKP